MSKSLLFKIIFSLILLSSYWWCGKTCDELGCLGCWLFWPILLGWAFILLIQLIVALIRNKKIKEAKSSTKRFLPQNRF